MKIWNKHRLVELGLLARGKSKHRPRDAEFLYGGDYPFIQTGDVKSANHRITKHSQTYSEEGLKQSKLWPKGTICITIAANIADTAILTYPACFPDSILGFVVDESKCDVDFMEYLLQHTKRNIQSYAIGSVQDNINLGTFENIDLEIPDLATQIKIASILSVLDEKIELNRQLNITLVQIAHALFEKYFVEDIDPNNLPEGWTFKRLGEHCNIFRGASPRPITDPKYFSNGTIPWIRIADATAENSIYINSTKEFCTELAVSKSRFLKKGSLILSNSATVGVPKILNIDGCIHDGWLAFDSFNNISRNYLFFILIHNLKNFHQIATGSVQNNLNTGLLKNLNLFIPTQEVLDKFDTSSQKIFDKILNNENELKTLSDIRDSLLPKLMNGEIEIEEIETIVA